jgi:ribosomal protein L18E
MPIRINLLAEAHAAEELRRKDPVKRGIYGAVFVVSCVLIWALTLQLKIIAAKHELGTLETQWKSIYKDYQVAVDKRRRSLEVQQKLSALQALNTNRFLWGNVLNAFQQTLGGAEDVQVARLKTEQTFHLQEEIKPRTNSTSIIPGKPASSTEKVTVTVEALDFSAQAGGLVNRFKENIGAVDYFSRNLQRTNGVLLNNLSPPQTANGRTFVNFTLQCYFPEKTRF